MGVVQLPADEAQCRPVFEFARKWGSVFSWPNLNRTPSIPLKNCARNTISRSPSTIIPKAIPFIGILIPSCPRSRGVPRLWVPAPMSAIGCGPGWIRWNASRSWMDTSFACTSRTSTRWAWTPTMSPGHGRRQNPADHGGTQTAAFPRRFLCGIEYAITPARKSPNASNSSTRPVTNWSPTLIVDRQGNNGPSPCRSLNMFHPSAVKCTIIGASSNQRRPSRFDKWGCCLSQLGHTSCPWWGRNAGGRKSEA